MSLSVECFSIGESFSSPNFKKGETFPLMNGQEFPFFTVDKLPSLTGDGFPLVILGLFLQHFTKNAFGILIVNSFRLKCSVVCNTDMLQSIELNELPKSMSRGPHRDRLDWQLLPGTKVYNPMLSKLAAEVRGWEPPARFSPFFSSLQ